MINPNYLPFDPSVAPLRKTLPRGSCDSHFHIFESPDKYPLAEDRSYTPTLATLEDYRKLCKALGIDRSVLIQPSIYGNDHSLYEYLLRECPDWRGVAVAYADTSDDELARWNSLGTRGTRCNSLYAGGMSLSGVKDLAKRVKPYNWHIQLLVDVAETPDVVPQVAEYSTVVVDHLGHSKDIDLQHKGFQNLLALLREGNTWVKLSAAYRVLSHPRDFSSLQFLVDSLVEANPNRLVWGTDWPHPACGYPMVDDGDMANALIDWLDDQTLHKVLVDNPTELYWGR